MDVSHMQGRAVLVSGAGSGIGQETALLQARRGADLLAFCTSKRGALGLSEALREELRPHGIGVFAIRAGIVTTHITRTSPLRGAAATPETRGLHLLKRLSPALSMWISRKPGERARCSSRLVLKSTGIFGLSSRAPHAEARRWPSTTPARRRPCPGSPSTR